MAAGRIDIINLQRRSVIRRFPRRNRFAYLPDEPLMNRLMQWWQTKSLSSPSDAVRERTVGKLAGSKDTVPLLLSMLADRCPDVRARTVDALGNLGDDRAMPALVELVLCERDTRVIHQITGALRRFDHQQITRKLISALDDQDCQVRHAAAGTLRRVGGALLTDALKARVAVILDDWTTAAEQGNDALEPLCAALLEGTLQSKRRAGATLGEIGTPEALNVLLAVLDNPSADKSSLDVVAWALRSYCWRGLSNAHLARVAVTLGDWEGVRKIGEPALPVLIEALADANPDIRREATRAIGAIATPSAVKAIAKVLSDCKEGIEIREEAVKALSANRTPEARAALIRALNDETWHIRCLAADALEAAGWRPENNQDRALFALARKRWSELILLRDAATKPLVNALHFQTVGVDAAKALMRLGPAGAEALAAVARDKNVDSAVREVAAMALAEAGDPRAVDALLPMLADADMAVRTSAVWTLERLNWKPTDNNQRALVAVAHGDFAALKGLGVAAVEPLLRLAAESQAPEQTAEILHHILEAAGGRLTIPQLRRITTMEDLRIGTEPEEGRLRASRVIDCSRLRQLARTELSRRGIVN